MVTHIGDTGTTKASITDTFRADQQDPAHYARVLRTKLPDPDSTITALNPTGNLPGRNLVAVNQIPTPPAVANFPGAVENLMCFSLDWFEKFHVRPGEFVFGNVLSTQQIPVSVYSAYRHDIHSWDAFVNNAGQGVSLINQPSLPYSFDPQTGLDNLLLEVTPSGPPIVDTTLDFVFDTMTISPIITLERLVLFDLPPELPYEMELEFLTDVQTHRDGSEHRLALRKNPRQLFSWSFVFADSFERARIANLLFDWHARSFGLPVWQESTFISGNIAVSDTVINVRSTAYADYRVGSLALIYESETKYDVLEIASFTSTTMTFTNGVQNAYTTTTRALVMPLRTGVIKANANGERFVSDSGKLNLKFRVLDNDSNLESSSGWTTYNSRLVLNGVRSTGGNGHSSPESSDRDIILLDNEVGNSNIDSLWPNDKRRSNQVFWAATPAEAWQIRQLIHYLRGRQVAFYLPTKGQDLQPTQDLVSASTQLFARNTRYSRYVQNRSPRNIIQVIFNDGTASVRRRITASSEVDEDVESFTVDSGWPANKALSTIERIEFLELCRFDSDTIRFAFNPGKTVRITAPVVTVFDDV